MNASLSRRGANALVETLQAASVSHVFTLSGNHIMPIFDALLGSGIRLIHTRHEAAAVHMADAFARITGTVGIALVTGGPGHANAVSALYTAQMAESALVLLSGHAPNPQIGHGAFQEMRQAEMAAPVCKASWTCHSADHVARDLAKAMSLARSGRRGPVHLSLPTDVLDMLTQSDVPSGGRDDIAAQELSADAVSVIVDRLSKALRPLILCGPQGLAPALRDQVQALREASGIPVVGMESPRGIADPSLGYFATKLAQSDCILLLGKRLDFTLKFGESPALSPQAVFLQVDAEQEELDRSQRSLGARLEFAQLACLPVALEQLARSKFWASAALTDSAPSAPSAHWREEVEQAINQRPPEWASASSKLTGRLHPVQALSPLQALLDSHPQSVLISDGGEIGQWAQAVLKAPCRVINGVAGSIGSALPFALAARVARPEAPVVAVMGDGTFGFHSSEIDTALRNQLPFVAVVGNDARWNAEYQIQIREYGADRTLGCELLPTHYDRVAQAFGGHGESVSEAAHLVPALQRAQASGLPAVVNVFIEGLPAPTMK
jgi:acetolactate synthase I/II/III large subunit